MNRSLVMAFFACLLTLHACGGGPSPVAPVGTPLDLSHRLPRDAALVGVVRLSEVESTLGYALAEGPSRAIGRRLAGLADVVGIDPRKDAWFAVSVGAPLAILRTVEDAERIVMESRRGTAPPGAELGQSSAEPATSMGASSLSGWVAQAPLPPAWVHVRLVGTASDTTPSLDGLTEAFGATQVIAAGDPVDSVAAALETTVEGLGGAVEHLAGRRLYRLLDADLPTIVTIGSTAGVVVVDLFQDQELGPNALVDALAARLGSPTGSASERVAGPASVTPLSGGERMRLYLDHRRWLLTTRALGEVVALQAVLSDGQTARDEAAFLRAARDAARLPERLMAPTLGIFVGTEIAVLEAERGLSARLAVRYTESARSGLSRLTDGRAPMSHAAAVKGGNVALTFALDPAKWAGALGEPVRPQSVSLSVLLQMVAECGFACVPAAWSTIPGFALDFAGALGSIFPELTPMTAALRTLGGANVVVSGDADARTFAAALTPTGPEARTVWAPLVEGMRAEWVGPPSTSTLVLGTSDEAYGVLRDALGPQAVTAKPVLQITARGPIGPVFQRVTVELRFEDREMVLAVTGRAGSP